MNRQTKKKQKSDGSKKVPTSSPCYLLYLLIWSTKKVTYYHHIAPTFLHHNTITFMFQSYTHETYKNTFRILHTIETQVFQYVQSSKYKRIKNFSYMVERSEEHKNINQRLK
jgi:hypothetical protein